MQRAIDNLIMHMHVCILISPAFSQVLGTYPIGGSLQARVQHIKLVYTVVDGFESIIKTNIYKNTYPTSISKQDPEQGLQPGDHKQQEEG